MKPQDADVPPEWLAIISFPEAAVRSSGQRGFAGLRYLVAASGYGCQKKWKLLHYNGVYIGVILGILIRDHG